MLYFLYRYYNPEKLRYINLGSIFSKYRERENKDKFRDFIVSAYCLKLIARLRQRIKQSA